MAAAFRLASLLRVRRLEEEREAARLAIANYERSEADLRRRQDETSLSVSSLPQHADWLHWQAAVASRAALGGLLAESTAAAENAAYQAKAAEKVWGAARARAVVLEKLEERHVAAEQAEELRVEQLVLDEVATQAAAERARVAAASAAEAATTVGTEPR